MFSGGIERDQWHTVVHCGVMETDHVDQHLEVISKSDSAVTGISGKK